MMNVPRDKTAENKIATARMRLLMSEPFFASLLLQLKVVDATQKPEIKTMATDGKNLFYNDDYINELSESEFIFVLAHEVLHVALEHHLRCGRRDLRLWNIACDYAVNLQLLNANIGKMPQGVLLDPAYENMAAEEIYQRLARSRGTKHNIDNDNQQSNDLTGDPGGCGAVLDATANLDDSDITALRRQNQIAVRQAVAVAAAQAGGRDRLPEALKGIIDQITKVRVDWRMLLRHYIDESSCQDYSWGLPNRRMLAFNIIMPGLVADGLSQLVIAVDTSASIDLPLLGEFAAEIQAAFDEGLADQLIVISADTKVRNVQSFEKGDTLCLNPVGRGNTAFADTFNWIRNNAPSASLVIYFTDLMTRDFGIAPDAPVLWAVDGDSKTYAHLSQNLPFGTAIHIC